MKQENKPMISWLHFGDLHMTRAGEENHRHFGELVDIANRCLHSAVDFAVLPGDNADDGIAEQFSLVARAASRLQLPLHILPGDHDFKQRSLEDFYRCLGADELPYSSVIGGYRCLFLDVVSAGDGGPDFRLDRNQLAWVDAELMAARAAGQPSALFMHTYPADLKVGGTALLRLLREHQVLICDMGHTHYNELANDGQTIFAATRSTGQIEEGPVGFSTVALDDRVVSWRFKPLASSWPWVQITTPADHRLVTDVASTQQVIKGPFTVRAKIWNDAPIERVQFKFGESITGLMTPDPKIPALWQGGISNWDGIEEGLIPLTVRGRDASDRSGMETLYVEVNREGKRKRRSVEPDGSDAHAVGAWPEKGILGTQLGPNRNGKKW